MPTPKTGEKHTKSTYCERPETDCCYPVWDRSNNLKKIGLCSLHASAPTAHEILSDLREWFSGTAPLYGSALIGDSDDTIHVRILKYFAVLEGR